jgi:hypothetical protein
MPRANLFFMSHLPHRTADVIVEVWCPAFDRRLEQGRTSSLLLKMGQAAYL